jgi:PAS domain S-box-containing protein
LAKETQRPQERTEWLLSTAEREAGLGTFEVDLRTRKIIWSDELYRIYGFEPGEVEPTTELILDRMHPDDREETEAGSARMLASPYPVKRHYRIQLDDGSVRHLVGVSQVEEDEQGNPVRLRGTVRDVTDSTQAERELLAHHELAVTLGQWGHLEEGTVDLLRRLGSAMDWDAANLWVPAERGDALVCRASWTKDSERLAEFDRAIRTLRIPPGKGTPWLVWDRQLPISVEDAATDSRVWAKKTILEAGFRSGVGFAAVHEGETLAVLLFQGKDPRHLTDRLMRTLTALGLELGRFFSTRRMELGMRELSARELEVLRLASEGHTAPRIAERLGIGRATVKTHFIHAYEKLGVSDRAAAVAEAMRRGLFD